MSAQEATGASAQTAAQAYDERSLRSLIENLPVAAYTCDRDGLLTCFNSRAVELWGRTPLLLNPANRFCGSLRLYDVETQAPLAHAESWVARALRDHCVYNDREIGIERDDGSRVPASVCVNPLRDPQGVLVGAVTVLSDLTANRKAAQVSQGYDERMFHAQKLESLGLLAGGIAHDFNNLLSIMLASTSLARRSLPEDSPAHESLGQLQEAVNQSKDLTGQMLDYVGGSKRAEQPCQLDKLTVDMMRLLRAAIPRGISIDLDLQSAPVYADVAQLRQIVMNLITNAGDALGERGGSIWVRTGSRRIEAAEAAQIEPKAIAPGYYSFLVVQDNGPGMTPEIRARIFDPFFSTKAKGRGLGLSAVLGIVRAHAGGVSVASRPEQGTRFELLLPLHLI